MAAIKIRLVIPAAVMLAASAAVAQTSDNRCAGDLKTQCSGIQPGEGRLKACIKSHLGGLSQTCEDRVLSVAVRAKTCESDVATLCKGIVAGTGGIRACIKSRMTEVSDPCKDAMSRAAAGRKILGEDL